MPRLFARYDSEHAFQRALRSLRASDLRVETTWSPVPSVDEAAGPSPVRLWVLVGAVLGGLSGLALTVGTALAWPLIVGGKPIVAMPAFLVVVFELTILLGALGGVTGFLVVAGLPARGPEDEGYDPSTGIDRFGLLVEAPPEGAATALDRLEATGATEARLLDDGEAR